MDKRVLEILEYKSEQTADGFYVTGYANTKGNEDAYGDIPTNYKGRPVYDLSRFKKNPVALVDHENSVGNIFGIFVIGQGATEEDAKGLKIKLRLMDNPATDIAKHAVEAYKSGFARAFSICGLWLYEDKENPKHLTKAIIHEISGVAIGADGQALSSSPKPKMLTMTESDKRKMAIAELIGVYRKNPSENILKTIEILRRV